MKLIAIITVTLFSYSVFAFESLDSTLAALKQTGIEAGGMDFRCPEGFTTSKELSNVPASFSNRKCEKSDNDKRAVIQIESVTPAKKNKIGRIYFSYTDFSDKKNKCTAETLKKFISPRKPLSVVNQYIKFDLGKDLIASVACPGASSGFILDIKTKIWLRNRPLPGV